LEEAALRLAMVRLGSSMTTAEARAFWAKALVSDRNPYVRAEAATEIVTVRHPEALLLLRRAADRVDREDAGYRGVVLSRIAVAFCRLGTSAALPDLEALVADVAPASVSFEARFGAEACSAPDPCERTGGRQTVADLARAALEHVTGEPWPNASHLRPLIERIGRGDGATADERRMLRRLLDYHGSPPGCAGVAVEV
jgi:hypothetical protein